MDVVQQEHTRLQASQELLDGGAVQGGLPERGRSFQTFQDAGFVALRLQPSDEPGSRIGQPLVVEIHGILCREDDAQPERARLLEQRQ